MGNVELMITVSNAQQGNINNASTGGDLYDTRLDNRYITWHVIDKQTVYSRKTEQRNNQLSHYSSNFVWHKLQTSKVNQLNFLPGFKWSVKWCTLWFYIRWSFEFVDLDTFPLQSPSEQFCKWFKTIPGLTKILNCPTDNARCPK